MKVVKLKAINIKKLKEIEIEPKGNLILISGKNGQGKTSMMDCLLYALAGKREIPGKPIREGENHAEIELDLGDLKVVRTFTEKDTYLKVLTKEGAEYPNAQAKLGEIVHNIYFDPMKFAGYSAKDQKDTLLQVIGVDITTEENQETEARNERTIVGRMLNQAKGELDGIPAPAEGDKKLKEVSVVHLSTELSTLRDLKQSIATADALVSQKSRRVEELTRELAQAKIELKRAETQKDKLVEENPDLDKEIEELQSKMANAEGTNTKVRQVQKWTEVKVKVDARTKEYNDLTEKIMEIGKTKEAKLKAAKMPVEGLGVTEAGVTYNGIPFDQLAKSEQIRVSLALAMAQDSGLKLIRIMDGSLLDSDNLKAIEEMADSRDYQVWIEIVDDSGEVGFFIEDGEVKKSN